MGDRRPAMAVLALVALAGTGCARTAPRPLPPSVPNVDIVMTEYHFEHPPALAPGRALFQVANGGGVEHEMTMLLLPPDLDLSVRGLFDDGVRRTFSTTATTFARPPGYTSRFVVDLQPGRYALICFLEDPDGVAHLRKGMLSEFRVEDPRAKGR